MGNRRVIRGQNINHFIQTVDCKFEPNLTFTDRDETGARRKVWTKDLLGPSAQIFLGVLCTMDLFVQQTRPTDSLQVLISLLLLHAAPYNLAQK